MITSNGRVIDLSYMCQGNTINTSSSQKGYSVSASDVCRAFASDVLTATNQFQRDKANDGLRYCLQNKDAIQKISIVVNKFSLLKK